MGAQLLLHPLFVLNLINQKMHETNPKRPKVFENLGWVALRGAMLGLCHLTVYNNFMAFVEQP